MSLLVSFAVQLAWFISEQLSVGIILSLTLIYDDLLVDIAVVCCVVRLSSHCYCAPVRERSIAISLSVFLSHCLCVCVGLFASISLEPLDRSSQHVLCTSPVAMAPSTFGGGVIRYVLPVIWMTPRLAAVGRISRFDMSESWKCAFL